MNLKRDRIFQLSLVILFLPIYCFSIIGNLRLSQANASADDGIMAHVVSSITPNFFKDDQIANIFRMETSSSLINWLPYLGKKYLGVNPEIFWYFFQFLQISLLAISFLLLLNRFVKDKITVVFLTLIAINIRPQMLNLSFSGDLEWMPYAGWLALGILLLSSYFYLSYKTSTFIVLNLIATFVHPTFGVWILLFSLLTVSITREKNEKISKNLLLLGATSIVAMTNLIRIYLSTTEENANVVPSSYLKSIFLNFHFNAINVFQINPEESLLLVGNLVGLLGLIVFSLSSISDMHRYMGNRSLIMLKSVLIISLAGILIQALGVLTKTPILVRLLGTRFTTLTTCILLVYLLIVISQSTMQSLRFKSLVFLTLIIFPGAQAFFFIGIYTFYINRSGMSKRLIRINFVLTAVCSFALLSTYKWIFDQLESNDFEITSSLYIFSESHLVTRNYFLEVVPQAIWPIIFCVGLLGIQFWQKVPKKPLVGSNYVKIGACLLLVILVLTGRYSNSIERFTEREKSFAEVQAWAREFSEPSSRFYIQSVTTYDGWRNYSLRPRTYLTTTAKPYAFYKTDLEFARLYDRRSRIFGSTSLISPDYHFLKKHFRQLNIDYLVCDKGFYTGDGSVVYTDDYFKIIKF